MFLRSALLRVFTRSYRITIALTIAWSVVTAISLVIAVLTMIAQNGFQAAGAVQLLVDSLVTLVTAAIVGGLFGVFVGAVGRNPDAHYIKADYWGIAGAVGGGFVGGSIFAANHVKAVIDWIGLPANPIVVGVFSGVILGGILGAVLGECVRNLRHGDTAVSDGLPPE